MNIHEAPENKDEKYKILDILSSQLKEIKPSKLTGIQVTCPSCNKKIKLFYAYRCFYCGLWFCTKCSAIHFKKGVKNET